VVDQDDPDFTFGWLPLEVVHHIFKALDPLALALAACTCSSWRAAAGEGQLWERHLLACFPGRQRARTQAGRARPQQQQQQQQQGEGGSGGGSSGAAEGAPARQAPQRSAGSMQSFAALARAHPGVVRACCCSRRLLRGRLVWVDPGAGAGGAPSAADGRHAAPAPVTVQQAVAVLRGGRARAAAAGGRAGDGEEGGCTDGGSGSDGGSSDEGGGEGSARRQLRLWAI
jgi:hypothetical protein